MDLEECKNKIAGAAAMINDAYAAVQPDKLKARRAELEVRQNDPALYSDPKEAQSVNSEAKYIDNTLGAFDKLFASVNDLNAMAELLAAETDAELMAELITETDALCERAEKAQISALLKGEYDKSDAILSLHAGAGGTEARRRGGYQEHNVRCARYQCLRLSQSRNGRASARSHFAVRCKRASAYVVRKSRSYAGDKRRHDGHDKSRRHSRRHVQVERRRRSAYK